MAPATATTMSRFMSGDSRRADDHALGATSQTPNRIATANSPASTSGIGASPCPAKRPNAPPMPVSMMCQRNPAAQKPPLSAVNSHCRARWAAWSTDAFSASQGLAVMPVLATSSATSPSDTFIALSRMVIRPLITSNARCSAPPIFGPTTLFRIATSSAQSRPET